MPEENAELLQRMTRLETKMDYVVESIGAVNEVKQTATEALQSARSAHHRLNDMQATQRWLIGTVISLAGVALAAIGFIWKVAVG